MPGSSPSRIQGYPQHDGIGERIAKQREQRFDLPWLMQKDNKAPGTEPTLFTEATGALLVGWGHRTTPPWWRRRVPSLSGLRSPGKKSELREPLCPKESSWKKNRERKGEKNKKEWHRETKLQWARPITLFSKGTFIPWLVHRGKWKMQSHTESAQTLHLFCLYWNQDFFLHTFPTNNVVYIIFWPWRPVDILWSFFDKGCLPRKLIFPWSVFSLYF